MTACAKDDASNIKPDGGNADSSSSITENNLVGEPFSLPDEAHAAQTALVQSVVEIERSAATLGWDRASTIYALVPTRTLLDLDQLPENMRQVLNASWDGSDTALTAVIQEDLPGGSLEETLALLGWPEDVVGAAVCTERVMVAPEVQDQAPADAAEAVEFFATHPDRDEVRIVVGVLRTGQAWSAIRMRSHDSDDEVGQGSNLVPGLTEALFATFAPAEERVAQNTSGCGSHCGCGASPSGCCSDPNAGC